LKAFGGGKVCNWVSKNKKKRKKKPSVARPDVNFPKSSNVAPKRLEEPSNAPI
jgi:hypothetical protein